MPVLATTATANERVTADVAEQLATGPSGGTVVLRGSLDRTSLRLSVVELPGGADRAAWLAAHLGELPGSGIIYTLTVAAATEVAEFLRDAGHAVAAYSGQTEQTERTRCEDDLLAGRLKALVATSALGMGFDKPDLGFVVHLGAPQSPVAYYQQVGRAGRALEHAEVVLLPAAEDRAIWAYFASLAFPPESRVRAALAALGEAEGPLSTAALETRVDLSRNRLEMMLKVLDVDGAVRRVRGGWVATGRPWAYDTERYGRVAEAREHEQQAMLAYIATEGCRMEFLRGQLDDPAAEPCGRCDNCTGQRWETGVPEPVREAARAHARRPGVEIAPRRQWPSGMAALGVPVSGRIGAGELAAPGRALGRLTDAGWGGRLRRMLAEGAPDEPVADDMFAAVVSVLSGWEWETRPVAVAALPSRSRPALISGLAGRLAEVGRLTPLGSLAYTGGGPARHHNSAQRLAAVWDAIAVPEAMRERLAGLAGPVLLVDDQVDTGWTLTVAAKLLRDAGAPAVLPLTLARPN